MGEGMKSIACVSAAQVRWTRGATYVKIHLKTKKRLNVPLVADGSRLDGVHEGPKGQFMARCGLEGHRPILREAHLMYRQKEKSTRQRETNKIKQNKTKQKITHVLLDFLLVRGGGDPG